MRCVARDHNRRIKAKVGQSDACSCAPKSRSLCLKGREDRGLHTPHGKEIRQHERHLPVADQNHMLRQRVFGKPVLGEHGFRQIMRCS